MQSVTNLTLAAMLAEAGIIIIGAHPWDPQVQNEEKPGLSAIYSLRHDIDERTLALCETSTCIVNRFNERSTRGD